STNSFKDSGIKGTLILALVENIQETDENIRLILSNIKNLDKIKYHICSDVKLINIIVGIQSCSSKHPCPYCETNNLENVDTFTEDRTLGSIRHSASAYKSAGSNKKVAQHYTNCINQPLLTGDDHERILDICAPPELHLLQGIVKHVYDNMYKNWPHVSLWLDKINVKPTNYHHGSFVGNDCLRMLKNVDILQQMAESDDKHIIQKYVHILRCFYDVVKSCFGMTLDPQYDTYINQFKYAYKDMDITITPKVHILLMHVPDFITKHNRSLGWYSEQTLESVH
ncbi:unnamed protein product, partial [Meganyctiphanes norvegica]